MTYNEINKFLSQFNSNSYNTNQLGFDKKTVLSIYEYLKKLNLSEETINILIKHIAYLRDENLNIPLYLELLSRTIGFISSYDLEEIFTVVKSIHDIYYENSKEIFLESYLHATEEERIKNLFLNRNTRYLEKDYSNLEQYINELKFATAMALNTKEYKEFLGYIDNFDIYKDNYSPLIVFKTYIKIRDYLKGIYKLFWDTLYGNEYMVAFSKHDLKITDIYKANIVSASNEKNSDVEDTIQLDIFNYNEYQEEKIIIPANIKVFQISAIYHEVNLPELDSEKDLLAYYKNILNKNKIFILPKLKSGTSSNYIFEVN